MEQTLMKERPILPLLLSMALPSTLSMMVSALYNIIDSFFVAKLSEDAMTALSLVYPMQNLLTAVGVGFAIGINAEIAFRLGARQPEKAAHAAGIGLAFSALHGFILMVLCYLFISPFLSLFTQDQAVLDLGLTYARIVLVVTMPITIGIGFEKVFQAVGRMTTSMFSMLLGCVTNIILDPLLIFGVGPFPQLGMRGAAIATAIGQTLSMVYYLVAIRLRPLPFRPTLKGDLLGRLLKRLYGVGVPATLNCALPSFQVSALNGILSAWQGSYVLVLGTYYKLQTFLYLTANGMVQGMRPIIGYNFGAGEHKRVRRIFTTTLAIIAGLMLLGTVFCQLFPGVLMGLFTKSSDTIAIGAQALCIISLGFVVSSLSVTACGALEGLGMGLPSLVISLLRYALLMVPAAWVLGHFFGPLGVWHSFWVTEVITAVISLVVYRRATGHIRG